jgi:peroxiredoxin-like protein
MSVVKTLRFPITAEWSGGRTVDAEAPGKSGLRVVTPPEFEGGAAGHWSPEELLVTAVASCYVLTLAAVADRTRAPIRRLRLDAVGHVEGDRRGHYHFTVIELEVELVTDPDAVEAAERAAALAEEHCIVSRALDVPVHVRVAVHSAALEEAFR